MAFRSCLVRLPLDCCTCRNPRSTSKFPKMPPWREQDSCASNTTGRSSAAVGIRLGLETSTLSLEQPARVNGPVWIHIQAPSFPSYGDVQYPVRVQPADFGCHQVEIRRDRIMLPRIPVRTTGGIMLNGPPCGQITIPGQKPVTRTAYRYTSSTASIKPACTKCGTRAGGARSQCPTRNPSSRPLGPKSKSCRRKQKRLTHRRKIQRKRSAIIFPAFSGSQTTRTSIF